jgi:hypothetical protein
MYMLYIQASSAYLRKGDKKKEKKKRRKKQQIFFLCSTERAPE